MRKESYTKVMTFLSSKNGLTQLEKDVVVRKVMENYYANIETVTETGSTITLNDTESKVLENTIASEENLTSYIDSAKAFITEWETGKETLFRKHINTGSFWKSVGSSVLASFIYTIIIVAVFWIGKDQIYGWLRSLSG